MEFYSLRQSAEQDNWEFKYLIEDSVSQTFGYHHQDILAAQDYLFFGQEG